MNFYFCFQREDADDIINEFDGDILDICPLRLKEVRAMLLLQKATFCLSPKASKGDWETVAIEACTGALEITPKNVEALRLRATAYRQAKEEMVELARDDEEAINELVGGEDLSSVVIKDQPQNPSDSQTMSKGTKLKYQTILDRSF